MKSRASSAHRNTGRRKTCFPASAVSVNLPKDADYCDIAEKLLNCAANFLADLEKKTVLSRVGPVNLGDPGMYAG